MTEKARGIHELYGDDRARADRLLWGRVTHPGSRRGFLRGSGLAAMSAAVGAAIPFAQWMPGGLIPAALAQRSDQFSIPGKDGLRVLNDRPLNAETPAHLLDDAVTPAERLFVRNNGTPPLTENIDPLYWGVEVAGESCIRPQVFTLRELQEGFDHHSLQLQLECGGNGRVEFHPPARGNQWSTGAVGCPVWTGVRLKDVLERCGVADDAVYVAYEAADRHVSGDASKQPISRGVPVRKAMEEESLIAWGMNGEPLPPLHGFPVRLVIGGWSGSVSGKWLTRILIRDRVHDGAKMGGQSYRVPCEPVAPGTEVAGEDMCIIGSMPVKSLITHPKSGDCRTYGQIAEVRGHAWAGDLEVARMVTSIDFGATWQRADLKKPVNRLAWQRWSAAVDFPQPGYYEIWARAVDARGVSQPVVLPNWNPRGYLNNACHRIAVSVA
ncbi:MAG: sulfite oxidase [Gammaproteobacteria bacterium]|nr:sulfite oxidase [Gammaproteobacteria bacterium]MDE0367660.1 sulfite oxidase [Gammaproteobacteria bacterium]